MSCALTLGQEALPLREAYLNSAPQAWEDYRQWATHLQGTCIFKSRYLYTEPAQQGSYHWITEFKQRKGSALLLEQEVVQNSKAVDTAFARVVNPQYGFELTRKVSEAPWVVSQYAPHLTFGGPWAPLKWVEKVAAYPVNLSALGLKVDYPSLDPAFKLVSVTAIPRDGRALAKVEFTFSPAKRVDVWLRGGWIIYDPDAHWVQRECSLNFQRADESAEKLVDGVYTATFEYNEGKPRFPLLKRIAARCEIPAKTFTNDETYEFRLQESEVPENAFALSAFGFPDPVGAPKVARGGISWYIWFAVIGFACLGAAFLLRRGLPWRAKGEPRSA